MKILNSSVDGFFARTELLALAGVESLVLVGQKRDWGKTRSSSVVLRQFCSLAVRAHPGCRTVSSYVHWKLVSDRMRSIRPAMLPVFLRFFSKCSNVLFASVKAGSEIMENGLLSGSERRKRSTAALRWISLMNFCKLTVNHLYSSQTCKNSSEKHSDVDLFLTFLLSVSKIWYVPPGLASHSGKIVVVTWSSWRREISMFIFEILQLLRET